MTYFHWYVYTAATRPDREEQLEAKALYAEKRMNWSHFKVQ